jgi:hypothetical protein
VPGDHPGLRSPDHCCRLERQEKQELISRFLQRSIPEK